MKKVINALLLIVPMLAMLITPALFGQWWLFTAFAVFFGIFAIIEITAVVKTGKSVSQKFWKLSEEKPWKAWIILVSMILAWAALIYHFGEKHLF